MEQPDTPGDGQRDSSSERPKRRIRTRFMRLEVILIAIALLILAVLAWYQFASDYVRRSEMNDRAAAVSAQPKARSEVR